MKHFLWLFILIPLVCYGADSKITDLPDVGASSDDVMYVVDNPGLSTASDNKITLGNLLLFFATQDMTLTGTIDASGATITFPTSITLDTPTFILADDGELPLPAALPEVDSFFKIASDGTMSFVAVSDYAPIPIYGELTTGHVVLWHNDGGTWKLKAGDLPATDNTTDGKIVKKVVTVGVHTLENASAGTDYVAPGGALGTPSGGTLTNCTGLPVSTGVAGLGTGIGTALGTNAGSAGAPSLIIAKGATALDFGSTATGECATVIQAAATGVASTDVIIFNPNASIKAVTGYVPEATGGFSITAFPTSNYVNFEACNWTAGTVDPGSITVNWMVIR